jgi:hypothetical protein
METTLLLTAANGTGAILFQVSPEFILFGCQIVTGCSPPKNLHFIWDRSIPNKFPQGSAIIPGCACARLALAIVL